VAWQFKRVAYFSFPLGKHSSDSIFELAVEAGADDVLFDEGTAEIYGPVEAFKDIADKLKASGIMPEEAELRYIANNEVELDADDTMQVLKLVESLEDHDDVQNVFHNLTISDAVMAQLEQA
jgi:transcriptional/translational regulatory protein YebC/TACO1